MCGCLSHTPTVDLACNTVMCPDWESNQRPFGLQASSHQEPHQPGLEWLLLVFDSTHISEPKYVIYLKGKISGMKKK